MFGKTLQFRKELPENIGYIELRDLGAGIEKIIKIMTLLEVISPKLILIDDFGSGLHPSLIKIFLSWLKDKENEWQTVISTHSYDVLHYLLDINPKDTSIIQLKKSSGDVLAHKSLSLNQIESFLDANNDPRFLSDLIEL